MILNSHKERTDFLFLTLETNLQIATVTESEIFVFLKYLMYSKYQPLSYYFTVLLYFLYTVELTAAYCRQKTLNVWVQFIIIKGLCQ